MHISKSKRCFNVKFLAYYFHVKTKMLASFHVYISVSLREPGNWLLSIFKEGFKNKAKFILSSDNLRGNLSCLCDKSSNVHFVSRKRISSTSIALLHQPFCMKDEWSPCRLPYFLVTVMCYFPPTILSSISFMFLSFSFRGLKNLVSSLMVVPGPWIL